MKLGLFVSPSFESCLNAQKVWREIAGEYGHDFAVIDITSQGGRALAFRSGVNVVPALLLEGRPIAVGVQTRAEARALMERIGVAAAVDKPEDN